MKKQIVSGVLSAAIAVTGMTMVLAAPKKAAKAKVVATTKKAATVKTPAKKVAKKAAKKTK